MKNFKIAILNGFEEVKSNSFSIDKLRLKKDSKLFFKELLGTTGMELSLTYFKPLEQMPFFHKHKENEEVYIVLKGKMEFTVDDEIIELNEGSSICVKPEGERYYKNPSLEDESLFLVIQAKKDSLTSSTIEDGCLVNREVR